MQELLIALMLVESGGNNNAIGDHGTAAGCLQIHKCVVDDVNRVYHTHYTWPKDCFNRDKSFAIAEKYLNIYAPRGSATTKARIWNGGPSGETKSATISYANKVKKHL